MHTYNTHLQIRVPNSCLNKIIKISIRKAELKFLFLQASVFKHTKMSDIPIFNLPILQKKNKKLAT